MPGEIASSVVLSPGQRIEFSTKPLRSLSDWLTHVASNLESEEEALTFYRSFHTGWLNARAGSRQPRKRQASEKIEELLPESAALSMAPSHIEEGDRILVYCDVMRSSLCSDFRGKLLRILSYEGQTGRQILYPVYYYPVEKQVIDCIYVELKTKYDEYFPFPDSDQPVVVVLHFRALQL